MIRLERALLALVLIATPLIASAQTAFTANDLVRIKRLTSPAASPDGRHVVFALSKTNMETNKRSNDLWLLEPAAKNAQPRRFAAHAANDSSPRWSSDSRLIYFLSSRSGSSQVWRASVTGGEPSQVTSYTQDVSTFKLSATGDVLVVTMEAPPKDAPAQRAQRVFDQLFIRHWDTWEDGKRSHVFTARIGAEGKASAPVDVSGAIDANVPSKPFGDEEEYEISPDGKRVVFSARLATPSEPWSTNFDLYEVPVDASSKPVNLTEANLAWDAQPTFLKNGDLAYLAMARPGFEADRYQILVRDARSGATRKLAGSWDRSPNDLQVSPDGKALLANVDDVGQLALYSIDLKSGAPRKVVGAGQVTAYTTAKNSVIVAWANLGAPADLYVTPLAGGTPRRITSVNADLLSQRALSDFEQFNFKGWNNETVYGYVIKPYGFQADKRYPVAYIVHGGPQASLQNQWNYRWNAQTFAARGYAVVMIDFHGSPGYGQAFTDSISNDWGGKPFEDLQKGLAAATERYSWLDGENACALGASYGGYMMNWFAGNWPDRFKCIVNHDGIFDQRSMYYSTEELWFPEWEHGGPYYDNPQAHEKHNPANFVKAWRTPMLVIHGALDYRVPLEQGISTFTALQRRGIESRLLYFPDENHWVLKPANSVLWYDTVLGWLDQHLKKK